MTIQGYPVSLEEWSSFEDEAAVAEASRALAQAIDGLHARHLLHKGKLSFQLMLDQLEPLHPFLLSEHSSDVAARRSQIARTMGLQERGKTGARLKREHGITLRLLERLHTWYAAEAKRLRRERVAAALADSSGPISSEDRRKAHELRAELEAIGKIPEFGARVRELLELERPELSVSRGVFAQGIAQELEDELPAEGVRPFETLLRAVQKGRRTGAKGRAEIAGRKGLSWSELETALESAAIREGMYHVEGSGESFYLTRDQAVEILRSGKIPFGFTRPQFDAIQDLDPRDFRAYQKLMRPTWSKDARARAKGATW